ncbi:MAG: cytochrome c [Cyanobacteria bacterium NC_groundwater_1444_Ag_S-0.65um_54_12]|nr:cytochrome c [Cyanobacteria bacterium NC_groundwater_1444_Ag_S-0.65um_54_12]
MDNKDEPTPAEPERLKVPEIETDVERLHRFVLRESREPMEGREPAPWWLWPVVTVALFAGGFYLGRHWGTFAPIAHIGYLEPAAPELSPVAMPSASRQSGSDLYVRHCVQCHQPAGKGLPGIFPPLAGSGWVEVDPAVPVRIILDGLVGPAAVAGVTYPGIMPAWRDRLSDDEIAAIATYLGMLTKADAPPISSQQVTAERGQTTGRSRPWTREELQKALPGKVRLPRSGKGKSAASEQV